MSHMREFLKMIVMMYIQIENENVSILRMNLTRKVRWLYEDRVNYHSFEEVEEEIDFESVQQMKYLVLQANLYDMNQLIERIL